MSATKNKLRTIFSRIHFYYKISHLFLMGKKTGPEEYSRDYDIVSSKYDRLWVKNMGKYTEEMLGRLAPRGNQRILDVGCGTGYITGAVKRECPSCYVLGIDNSRQMLEIAKMNNSLPKTDFILGDALEEIEKLPDDSFDMITFGWTLIYFDSKKVLREAHRILKKGGKIGVITNRKGTIRSIEDSFIRLMKIHPQKISLIDDIALRLPSGLNSIKRSFKQSGFQFIDGWEKEQTFNFNNGSDAVKWAKECGALAGTFKILDINDFAVPLAEELEKHHKKNNQIRVTHRFIVGVGEKC